MTTPLVCLVLYAMWAMLLVGAVGVWRGALVLTRRVPSSGFKPGEQHGSDPYWRVNRAHLNTVENLPIYGALALVSHLTAPAAAWVGVFWVILAARVVQSLLHLSSGAQTVVNLRFTAFVVQVLCMAYVGCRLVLLWAR